MMGGDKSTFRDALLEYVRALDPPGELNCFVHGTTHQEARDDFKDEFGLVNRLSGYVALNALAKRGLVVQTTFTRWGTNQNLWFSSASRFAQSRKK